MQIWPEFHPKLVLTKFILGVSFWLYCMSSEGESLTEGKSPCLLLPFPPSYTSLTMDGLLEPVDLDHVRGQLEALPVDIYSGFTG